MGPGRRAGIQVVLFKDEVVMKAVITSLHKEAYVKTLCNCLTARAKNKQTFSTSGG